MKKSTYELKWKKGSNIGGGGQGLTYLTTPIESKELFVLKLLKQQRSQERRDRMFMEVNALQVLQHNNIPKCIDTNVNNEYKNINVDLYFVSEYIPGNTLQKYIDINGVLSLPDALSLTIKLTEIIEYCHLQGFCHRDIKPDNIILKNDYISEPYLIDFGLSFNDIIEINNTPDGQHLGNRFLSLPELRLSGNKRDLRSDLTMICGIFLFCLTSIHPTDLLDASSTKPHRRDNIIALLEKNNTSTLNALNLFFDVSFQIIINNRWQSAESLLIALKDLQKIKTTDEMNELDLSEQLENFKNNFSKQIDYKELDSVKNLFLAIDNQITASRNTILNELREEKFDTMQGGYNLNLEQLRFTNCIGICHPYLQSRNFLPEFNTYVNGSEIVLTVKERHETNEILRTSLNQDIDWESLDTKLKQMYIKGITENP